MRSKLSLFVEISALAAVRDRSGRVRILRARPQPRRENHSSGLRTRAFPAGQGKLRQLSHRTKEIDLYFRGVTARRSPGLVKLCVASLAIAQVVIESNLQTSSGEYTETPTGRKE